MDNNKLVSCLAIGICFAIAFGFAFHNIALGIGLGVVFGGSLSQADKFKNPPSE